MSSSTITSPLMRVPLVDADPSALRPSPAPDASARAPTPQKQDPPPARSAPVQAVDPKPTNTTVRKTAIDWETGAMVYRVIDEHSGTTVSQSPDEALLRLRAYARQSELELQTEAKGSSNAQIRPSQQSAQTDQTALAPSQTPGPTGVLIPRPSKTV